MLTIDQINELTFETSCPLQRCTNNCLLTINNLPAADVLSQVTIRTGIRQRKEGR